MDGHLPVRCSAIVGLEYGLSDSRAVEIHFDAARKYAVSHRCPVLTAGEGDELLPVPLLSFPEGWCLSLSIGD